MGLVFFAIKSLVRRGHRNLLAIIILAFGLMVFFVGNALLDGGAAGLAQVYRDVLIGDGAIAQTDPQPVSIWGYEELFSSQFTKIPVLEQAENIRSQLNTNPEIASVCPLVGSAALLELGTYRNPVYLMGTSSSQYFPSRKFAFKSGTAPLNDQEPWIVISSGLANAIEASAGKYPAIGDVLQITFADNNGFTIRALPLVGIFEFPVQNSAFDSLCIVDIPSAWDLLGLAVKQVKKPVIEVNYVDPNDPFSDGTVDLNQEEDVNDPKSDAEKYKRPVDGSIHFLLLKYKNPNFHNALFLSTKQDLVKESAHLMDWKMAAGQSLRYIVSIQLIFNIGMLLFSVLILLIIANTLSNAIIERKAEVGILRALGARRRKVALVFSVEFVAIGLVSLLISLLLASITVIAINAANIHLTNEVLVNLFGGSVLKAMITPELLVKGLLLALAFPLLVVILMSGRLAAITPQQAMQNGS